MRYIQELIQKAHDKGLLRYAPPNLVWDEGQDGERQFELRRTAMSGVEFGYNLTTDEITWAIQSIDGVELEPSELLQELIDKTSDPKPENDEEPMRECDQCGRTDQEAPVNELRAPDPTLTALDADASIWIEESHPRVAHTISTNPRCVKHSHWHEEAQDARWFAVPCRECFPTAPPRGQRDHWRLGSPDPRTDPIPGLEWQTRDPENQRRIKGDWDEQPCQHYAQTRAIVDEEPEVTEHSTQAKWDRGLNRYIVTETTSIDAYSEEDAIERVVSRDKSGKPEVVSQEAEIQLERWRVGHESYFWAENREHAIEQYLDWMNNDNALVAEIVSYE